MHYKVLQISDVIIKNINYFIDVSDKLSFKHRNRFFKPVIKNTYLCEDEYEFVFMRYRTQRNYECDKCDKYSYVVLDYKVNKAGKHFCAEFGVNIRPKWRSDQKGYIVSDGINPLHRLVITMNGNVIPPNNDIHHIGHRFDNRYESLQILTKQQHGSIVHNYKDILSIETATELMDLLRSL